jgi:type I restriction enzyme M protein
MLNATIKSMVDKLWDKLWSDGIANPLTAMEQISYLLFMRRLDAIDLKRSQDAKFTGDKYVSTFKGHQDCRWSKFRNLPGSQMLSHVQDKVFPFIKKIRGGDSFFTKYMAEAVFLIPKESLLVEAVGIIDEIYAEIERQRKEDGETFHDTQGDLYEYLLSEISTAGKNGQFRTPRHIIHMIVNLVDPKLGDEIVDPAAGTGGFLLGAYQHIITANTSAKLRFKDENGFPRGTVGDKLPKKGWDVLSTKTLHGYDFDVTMVRIGLMNLLLHEVETPNFQYMDTLSKRYDEVSCFDVCLANPPFKGSIDKGDINEELSVPTTKTELLFVDRIINLLRIGGRAGVIVPDGVLFGSSKAHTLLRKMLIENCELQAVISMPSGVFKPYAGVSTAVLVFVKGGQTEHVWFYDMQADGYSLDDKRDKTKENDIPDVLRTWKARRSKKDTDRKQKAFFVSAEEIKANKYDLSINRYIEIEDEAVEYQPPKVTLKKLRKLEKEFGSDLYGLEGMLGTNAPTGKPLRSPFLKIFGDPVNNPKNWETVSLGSQVSEFRYGTSSKCGSSPTPNDLPVLRIPNIVGGSVLFDDLKYASLQSNEIKKLMLRKGDLIFVRSNSNPNYIGRCAVFPGNKKALFASYLIRARFAPNATLSPLFARILMSQPSFRSQLVREAQTTTGNYNISAKRLAGFKLICPPVDLQKKFVELEGNIEALKQTASQFSTLLDSLYQSFFHRAFKGQL